MMGFYYTLLGSAFFHVTGKETHSLFDFPGSSKAMASPRSGKTWIPQLPLPRDVRLSGVRHRLIVLVGTEQCSPESSLMNSMKAYCSKDLALFGAMSHQ